MPKVKRKTHRKPVETLDWTIVARVKPGRVEFVTAPKDSSKKATFKEEIVQVVRGHTLPKPKDGSRPVSWLDDVTGLTAQAAFRMAVRDAKARDAKILAAKAG